MKKIILIILGTFLILASIGPFFAVNAEDNRSKINNINKEIEKSKKELKDIEISKEDIRKNLQAETKKLENYQKEIKNLEVEIDALERKKAQLEYDITKLEEKIEERKAEIDEAEKKVKSYMVQAQSSLYVNSLFEFLMGSEDFSTMILRLEGMSAIKRYNEDIIRQLAEEKAALEKDKDALVIKKEALEVSEDKLKVEVEKKKAYEERMRKIVDELKAEEQRLEEQAQKINHKNKAQEKKIKEIQAQIAAEKKRLEEEQKKQEQELAGSGSGGNGGSSPSRPSPGNGGFVLPASPGSYRVTASVWQYPWGAPHMGVDLGINRGTPTYAVGSGLVVASQGGCSEGNWNCGYGYGNFVSYIVNVNGHNYGIIHAHLSRTLVSSGQAIAQGQVIGYTGNTGISTGPHLHVETINMGPGTLMDAWNRWDGTYNFGTGPASWGGRRCDQGYGVPCRMNPHGVLGI